MIPALAPIAHALSQSWRMVLLWGLLFSLTGQLVQLVMLIVRFGDLPNYFIHYDWLSSLVTIVQSTQSFRDMLPIMFDEWWIEIGFMNYDYGNGISEWGLNIMPSRLLILFLMGCMVATLVLLRRSRSCSAAGTVANSTAGSAASMAGAGLGALLICTTSAAMSWVVCCATPSWVVGLAMLCLSVSASLALEGLGPTLFYTGFALLSLSLFLASRAQASNSRQVPEAVAAAEATM